MISFQMIFTLVLTALSVYAATLVYVRMVGLRSFSKMTSLDFAMTIAVGSLIASIVMPSKPTLLEGFVAIGSLFLIQWVHSMLRKSFKIYRKTLENTPVVIMRDGVILPNTLASVNMVEEDLMAKLREANVLQLEDVRYAVLETTGDVTVLHGNKSVDEKVMLGVKFI